MVNKLPPDDFQVHEEDNILVGLQQGKESAYQTLFHKYYASLTAFALQYTNDVDTAQEIVQEVFVSLYQKRSSIHIEKSLKSYLFQAVYHRFLNSRTQQERRAFYHNEAVNEQGLSDYYDAVEQTEALQQIYQAIERLPGQCRRIFTMNRFEGINNQAIADQLGLSKRTVETQISKALKLLRQSLMPLLPFSILLNQLI